MNGKSFGEVLNSKVTRPSSHVRASEREIKGFPIKFRAPKIKEINIKWT